MALACINGIIKADKLNRPRCTGEWVDQDVSLEALDGLSQLLETLFMFDPEIFFIVLSAEILFFFKGKAAGLLNRYLSK